MLSAMGKLTCFVMFSIVLAILGVQCALAHEVYFSESFPSEESITNWVVSKHDESKLGKFKISAGKSPVDPKEDLGLQTTEDSRFYAITRKLTKSFSNREKTLVIQYTVKYDKTVDCGGAYVKLLGSDVDQNDFHDKSPYKVMFGPDICGYTTRKVHVILNYKGDNHQISKDIRCKDDLHTHLYTLILKPDNTYEVLIDNEKVESGSIEDDLKMLPPKKIDDPNVKKPSDWVDEVEIDDPNDKKPEDWDQPETIPDMDAKKPDDWDDAMDGDWERPKKPNPDFKGEWKPKRISNPDYKGPWVHPQIDNPDYKPDPTLYAFDDIGTVGFELWQVVSGSIFDNILITDDPAFAKEEGERVWKKRHDAEIEKEKEEAENEKKAQDAKDKEEEETSKAEKIVPVSGDSEKPEPDKQDESESHDEL